MIENYKIIYGDKENIHIENTEEKKSKFICYIKKVETEIEATDFIKEIKKKHYDASHNCSAFIIGNNKELIRCSDDGEPQGTAGKPMLDILMGSDIVNIVTVVTRYFGGTLLGTGGLVRAYGSAVQAGLQTLPTAIMTLGKKIDIYTDYQTIGAILHLLKQENIPIDHSEYNESIVLSLTVEINKVEDLINQITEISSAKSKVDIIEEIYFLKEI